MLAHRDQENLVHSHQQGLTKQQPKTPGARYPKTPGNFGRGDENALIAFADKSALGGGAKPGGQDRLMTGKLTGQRQTMFTPMNNRARAPLGNKTTNAKARTGRTVGVKDMVREIEKTQTKQTSGQRPKQRPVDPAPIKLNTEHDTRGGADDNGVPEPEYAPPRPTPLPYESDVLPPGGLTFNGLKKGNLLKGYYQHFHNPIDEDGISRVEKKFNQEMEAVLQKAEERNAREVNAIGWSPEDIEDNHFATAVANDSAKVLADSSLRKARTANFQKQPATISARRAASVLAVHSDKQNSHVIRPASSISTARGPLSTTIPGTRPARPVMSKPSSAGNSTGEVASRTTLGYNKGRSASFMVHSRGNSQPIRQRQQSKPAAPRDVDSQLTITPARIHQATLSSTESSRPRFMSIFDDENEEGLPPLQKPFAPSDDEEDEFELKLTI
ncbi:uncharacterized protein MAM_06684 [Metarhizium album ARSEF 1941]|uniref:Uncharacterized protein n=1 Tax=Metarhizium album (strain ARSEF 1941) TaxID=1081103 RepID=A0A0B2WPK4_METAS|nr:uncharacterized protein MAM_06684 [Metarhizium album ARSEF 1941]KHN95407.1 hypothetical protein MAM_06684 [Metarhizium album ARSEF 1941]